MADDVVVLGLGNLLRRDEGLGVVALQRLRDRYDLGDAVVLLDGGTLGLDLVSHLEGATRLVVLDAVLDAGPPGTMVRLSGDEVPVFFGTLVSTHDIGLSGILALMRLRGTEPPEVVVLGMVPEVMELGLELSEPVAGALDRLVESAADELRQWGVPMSPRSLTEAPVLA
jgi:hydrogenase maturation protease